jgi:hypothetical protein
VQASARSGRDAGTPEAWRATVARRK